MSSQQTGAPAPDQLPIRAYLEANLIPLTTQAMAELAKERPADAIEFIANYLLANNP